MPRHPLTILLFMCLSQSVSHGQILPDTHSLYVEIDKLIRYETEITSRQTPGILVGIVDGKNIIRLSIGQKDFSSSDKLQPGDLFEIGSLTKALTAALLSRLTNDKFIDWKTGINTLLPESCRNAKLQGITLSDLATHQSGFPKYPPYIGRYEASGKSLFAHYPGSAICNYMQGLDAPPGGAQYSHLNFGIIEIMLEHLYKRDFAALADSLLFHPLGMTSTGFGPSDTLTPGYDLSGTLAIPMEFASCSASEGARSTMNDLLRFLRWNLGLLHVPKMPFPVAEALQSPDFPSNLGNGITFTRGWFLVHPKKKRDVFIHSGRSRGHHASISFCPQTGTGVIVLSNSAFGTDNLGYLILRTINRNWKRKSNG